jgi:K+-sensing histidine kinase KdpD
MVPVVSIVRTTGSGRQDRVRKLAPPATRDPRWTRGGSVVELQVDRLVQAHRPVVDGLAAAAPLVVCAVLSVFRDSVANTNAALALVLLVVAAASTGIRLAGLVAALSCAAWFDFFLTEPYHLFTITDPADVETAALLVLVGIAVSEIALWGRRQQAKASREQGYLDGVLTTAATVGAGHRPTTSLVDEVCAQIVDVLQLDDCRFDLRRIDPGSADTGTAPILATLNGDATMTYNGLPYDVQRHGLPTDSEIALPVQSGGLVRGRLLLTAATRVSRPTTEQLRIAVALASQVGAALSTPHLNGRSPT